jgi:hypothetical protein
MINRSVAGAQRQAEGLTRKRKTAIGQRASHVQFHEDRSRHPARIDDESSNPFLALIPSHDGTEHLGRPDPDRG